MTEVMGRNRRVSVQITVSSMFQWEKQSPVHGHRQQTALLVDVQQETQKIHTQMQI